MPVLSRIFSLSLSALVLLLSISSTAVAEVQVTADRNSGDSATANFGFENIPTPVATDAGNLAKISLIEGKQDLNGAGTRCLIDGKLPKHEDEPASNFFFATTAKGMIAFDLGESIEIQQINTYSWHPMERGPQVYTVYGAPANAKKLDLRAKQPEDLAKAGWIHITDVDTRDLIQAPEVQDNSRRPRFASGQIGVSIHDAKKNRLGNFRYLLFVVSPTLPQAHFAQTFFSEIDIVDGKEHPKPPQDEQLDTLEIAGKYSITFDTTEVPELRGFVNAKLKPVCTEWYPKLVEMLPSDDYTAPQHFTITFKKDMGGVAFTAGTRVQCSGNWYLRNQRGEGLGSIVHEMVHVVQQFRGRRRRGNRNPGWMVEGTADYIRWFLYEPADKHPSPNPERSNYDDSYRTSAAFLNYVIANYDADLIKKMTAAMREGSYSDELWNKFTNKTAPELWQEYIKTL